MWLLPYFNGVTIAVLAGQTQSIMDLIVLVLNVHILGEVSLAVRTTSEKSAAQTSPSGHDSRARFDSARHR